MTFTNWIQIFRGFQRLFTVFNFAYPLTLVHGDLHFNNIASRGDNYIFFDWTDACIAPPFFDMMTLFFVDNPKDDSVVELRHTYLSEWLLYASMEALLQAWEIARPLCALHYAVTNQYLVKNLEPRTKHEYKHLLPKHLRYLLTFTEDFVKNDK
ncbi:MAG: phosphotransferase [Leptolyngbyaceae cyanobacterium MO_188.B28]|nr:phosphotransferase [Leptolyngbyaceae cyanobacterium MO_188.B28]